MRECGLATDCRTDREWEETLLGLLGNKEARRQAGQKGEAFAQHQHLDPVQQLADLLSSTVRRLVLRGHPHLSSLFDDLLALVMDAVIQGDDGSRVGGPLGLALSELSEEFVEGFHRR